MPLCWSTHRNKNDAPESFCCPKQNAAIFSDCLYIRTPGDRNSAIGICSPWGFHRTLCPCHNSVLALWRSADVSGEDQTFHKIWFLKQKRTNIDSLYLPFLNMSKQQHQHTNRIFWCLAFENHRPFPRQSVTPIPAGGMITRTNRIWLIKACTGAFQPPTSSSLWTMVMDVLPHISTHWSSENSVRFIMCIQRRWGQ